MPLIGVLTLGLRVWYKLKNDILYVYFVPINSPEIPLISVFNINIFITDYTYTETSTRTVSTGTVKTTYTATVTDGNSYIKIKNLELSLLFVTEIVPDFCLM